MFGFGYNPFMAGPMRSVMEKGMLAQMEVWKASDPQRYSQLVNEITSWDRATYVKKLRAAAKKQGVNLDEVARSIGVTL